MDHRCSKTFLTLEEVSQPIALCETWALFLVVHRRLHGYKQGSSRNRFSYKRFKFSIFFYVNGQDCCMYSIVMSDYAIHFCQ